MPGPNFVLDKGFQTQTALTQWAVVKYGTSDQTCTAVTGLNDLPLGITQEAAVAGDVTKGRIVNVRLMGISRCIAGAALTRGTRVRSSATGTVVAASGTAGTVDNMVGILMFSSAATGDFVDVLLTPGVSVNTAVS